MHHLVHHSPNEVDSFVPDHLNTQLTMDEINQILDLPASTFFELASNEHAERTRYGSVCSSSNSSTETSGMSDMELDIVLEGGQDDN